MKLTRKDLKIMCELDGSGRNSFSQIGKAVGLTKETARNKVHKLVENEVLVNTYPLIASHGLVYHVYLTLSQASPDTEDEIEQFMQSQKCCVFVYVCEGPYTFKAVIQVQSNDLLIDFFERLRHKFNKILKEKDIHPVYTYQKFSLNSTKSIATFSSKSDRKEFSDNQKKILKAINTDARKSVIKIGQETGLTARVVTHQLKVLKPYILSYAAMFNAEHMGKLRCFFDVSLHDLDARSQIVYFFAKEKVLRTAVTQLGKYDLSLEIFVDSIEELRNIIREFKELFYENYAFFDTAIVLKTGFNGWFTS